MTPKQVFKESIVIGKLFGLEEALFYIVNYPPEIAAEKITVQLKLQMQKLAEVEKEGNHDGENLQASQLH